MKPIKGYIAKEFFTKESAETECSKVDSFGPEIGY